jgi:hypothetical protein
MSTSRAVVLWHLLRMQSRIEGEAWLTPRLLFLTEAGLGDRKARSRAVAELEQAGLAEVRRRPGKLPLLRLKVGPKHRHGGTAMEYSAAIDVSLEWSSVCVVNAAGQIVAKPRYGASARRSSHCLPRAA